MKRYLLLDCNYLCWRAYFTTGELSHGDVKTGVIYGFLRDVINFQEQFEPDKIIFCFDLGVGLREQHFPEYKANRRAKEQNVEQIILHNEVTEQIRALRREYLPEIGFNNVFYQKGYEADDIIASICRDISKNPEESGIIITEDKDLYQLLSPNIQIYNPRKKRFYTIEHFKEEFGIKPKDWCYVKTLSGCISDGVKGLKGIGEKRACAFIRGEVVKGNKFINNAIREGEEIITRNLQLVTLPFPGVRIFTLMEDSVSEKGWQTVLEALGIKSLIPSIQRTVIRQGLKRG